jgi:hypothetical protein
MRTLIAASVLSTLVASCASAPPPATSTVKGQRELEILVSFLTGNWDTRPEEPPMRMRVAQFWPGSPARWFYFEWTKPGSTAPTRQFALRVSEMGEGHFRGDVYRLPEPSRYAGEWSKAQPFATLKPEDLRLVDDCRMRVVHTLTAHFTLGTEGNRCPGDIPGSPYMRFEYSLASSELELLEQPRDAAGNVAANSRLEPFKYLRMAREPS